MSDQIGGPASGDELKLFPCAAQSSRRAVIAAQQSTQALSLDDLRGGGVVARFGRDQLVPQSKVWPLIMEVNSVLPQSTAK